MAFDFQGKNFTTIQYDDGSDNVNATLTLYNQRDYINRASAAATFYSAKYIEYKLKMAMITSPRSGETYPHVANKILHPVTRKYGNGGKYTASAVGEYPGTKTGRLANINGQNKGYQALTSFRRKVDNAKQFYESGEKEMEIGHFTDYGDYLTKVMGRAGLEDIRSEMQYGVREITEGIYYNAYKTSQRKGAEGDMSVLKATPRLKSNLFDPPDKYRWLADYVKRDNTYLGRDFSS